ncbi:MAG: hypothetical protein ACLQBB_00895 [Solirubrobacteraceae bacterium]
MSDAERGGPHQQRCVRCGTVLEPHEPVVVTVGETHAGRTSLAALGALRGDGITLIHEQCHATEAPAAPGRAATRAGVIESFTR